MSEVRLTSRSTSSAASSRAIEDAKTYVDLDTGHDYDGIRELDNNLPTWWLMTLYGAIVFAAVYWVWFETLGIAPDQREELAAEYALAEQAEQAREAAAIAGGKDPNSHAELVALTEDAAAMAAGAEVYAQTCAACHRADGGGLIGPNMTDDFFLHGATADAMYRVVAKGVLDKGMPAWAPVLGAEKTRQVTAYVYSMRGKPVADGKAPQGEQAP